MASSATQTGTSTWRLDPAHSSVEFSVKHMMMTTVRGRFKEIEATLTADEEHPEGCCVEVKLQVASVDTGIADRDAHLQSPDFFDAPHYPKITFKSRESSGEVERDGDRFKVTGDLSIHGATMEVTSTAPSRGGAGTLGKGAGRLQRPNRDRPPRVGAQVEPGDRDGRGAGGEQGADRGGSAVRAGRRKRDTAV